MKNVTTVNFMLKSPAVVVPDNYSISENNMIHPLSRICLINNNRSKFYLRGECYKQVNIRVTGLFINNIYSYHYNKSIINYILGN